MSAENEKPYISISLRVPREMGETIERIARLENNPVSAVCRRLLAEAIREAEAEDKRARIDRKLRAIGAFGPMTDELLEQDR